MLKVGDYISYPNSKYTYLIKSVEPFGGTAQIECIRTGIIFLSENMDYMRLVPKKHLYEERLKVSGNTI